MNEKEQLWAEIERLRADCDSMRQTMREMEFRMKADLFRGKIYAESALERYANIVDNYLQGAYLDGQDNIDNLKNVLSNAKCPMVDMSTHTLHEGHFILDIIFGGKLKPFEYMTKELEFDLALFWGAKGSYEKSKLIAHAKKKHVPAILLEDGFIESVIPSVLTSAPKMYRAQHSITADCLGAHFMGGVPSTLEKMLNSDRELSAEELTRAKNLINKIRENKISKYNHQPIEPLSVGRPRHEKVLLIDQVWGDQSITDGLADESTFTDMFDCAVNENPDADIIIKTHPVSPLYRFRSYFEDIPESGNIYKVDWPINPISLMGAVDKVYVCSSQMGFEALMCGKDVHVFGMPFYAGWGATQDKMKCPRRTRKRSVEEIFYMAYIDYSIYVSHKKKCICEIEDAIDEILELREEYWKGQDENIGEGK